MRALLACLALTGCTGAMDEYFARDVVDIDHDVPYGDADNPRQFLDLYMPRGAQRVPMVVFVHGGFWIRQDKSYFEPVTGLYANVGIALARQGIGVAVINYQLVPSVTFDQQFADVAHSIRWVEQHIGTRGGDPTNIVMAGHSAGGHITALAAFVPDRLTQQGVDTSAIRGFAPLSPIFDLAALAASPPHDNAEIVETVFGDNLAAYSPTSFFTASVAPLLVMLGENDLVALRAQVPPAIDTLRTLGADVRYEELAGKDHDAVVLDFDGDEDAMTPLLVSFVHDVTTR